MLSLNGPSQLRNLGKAFVKDFQALKVEAMAMDQQDGDLDPNPGHIRYNKDEAVIHADVYRMEDCITVTVDTQNPEKGVSSRSITYKTHPFAGTLEITTLDIAADQRRFQTDLLLNQSNGTIMELTTSDWMASDIP